MKAIHWKKRGKHIAELNLSGVIGIQEACELAIILNEASSLRKRLMVRCDHLESLDSAALQILHSASRSFDEATLEVAEPAWQASFARAGLENPFNPKDS